MFFIYKQSLCEARSSRAYKLCAEITDYEISYNI